MTRKYSFMILAMLLSFAPMWLAGDAAAQVRNAAFANPNSVASKPGDGKSATGSNTVVADPGTIDAGETLVNVARRVTVFFYNGFRSPVQMNDLTLNADGNVRGKVMTDDCKTIKTLPVGDKCSVALEITPSSPGPWTVELLLNHSGMGRIARAEVTGSTLGKADEKAEGLAISKKIAATLDFGSVAVNEERSVRTMLIENDSAAPLIVSSIDLIATEDEGLAIRKGGCKEGDELKAGESCPITVMWEPRNKGNIATDLIVRHSGNLGFVVVPIRGNGTMPDESKTADAGDGKAGKSTGNEKSKSRPSSTASSSQASRSSGESAQAKANTNGPSLDALPLPSKPQDTPSAQQVANTMPPISSSSVLPKASDKMAKTDKKLPAKSAPLEEPQQDASTDEAQNSAPPPEIVLIGTVGGRAILGDVDEQTYMVGLGEKTIIGGEDVELLQLDPTRAVVNVSGQRLSLSLRRAQTFMQKKAEKGSAASSKDSPSAPSDRKKETSSRDPEPKVAPSKPAETSSAAPLPVVPSVNPAALAGALTSGGITPQDVLNMVR